MKQLWISNPVLLKRILRNVGGLVAVKIANLIIPILAIPFLIAQLGMNNFGLLSISLALGGLAGSLIQYGFPIYAVREISRCKGDRSEISIVYSSCITVSILFSLLLVSLFISVLTFIDLSSSTKILYSGAFLLMLTTSLFPHWLFLGLEKVVIVACITLGVRSTYLVLLFIFIDSPDDYIYVHWLNSLTSVSGLFVGFWLVKRICGVSFQVVTQKKIIAVIRDNFKLFLIQLVPNLYNSLIVVFLGATSSAISAGIFSAANTIVDVFVTGGRILAGAFLPILSTDMNEFRKFAWLMLLFSIASVLILMIFSPYYSSITSSNAGNELEYAVNMLAFSVPLAIGYLTYSTNYLCIRGHESVASKITLICSISGALSSLLLVSYLDWIGAVMALLFTRGALFLSSFIIYLVIEKQLAMGNNE